MMRQILQAMFWAVLIILAATLFGKGECIAQAALPDSPKPQCQAVSVDELTMLVSYVDIPCDRIPQVEWRELPKPTHRGWFYRHQKATALILASSISVTLAIALRPHGCPHMIDGVGYDGTPPCPKSCDGPGDCYWGPGHK